MIDGIKIMNEITNVGLLSIYLFASKSQTNKIYYAPFPSMSFICYAFISIFSIQILRKIISMLEFIQPSQDYYYREEFALYFHEI